MRIFLLFFSLLFFNFFNASAADENNNNYIKIDFRLNTKKSDSKNYFNWKTSSTNLKDSFDAVSGASLSHSTKEFRNATSDKSGKNLLTPRGLRALLLFAVSSFDTLEKDNLTVDTKGRQIEISFKHRGIAYKIITDENGALSIPESFFITSLDSESKNNGEENQLTADTISENASESYSGKLFTKLDKNGILKINGKLVLKSKPAQISPQTPEQQENTPEQKPV